MEITVDIDDDIYAIIERRAQRNDFDSPEEYCQIVIRTVVEELEEDTDEDVAVEERLEDLGYLN